MLQIGGIVVLFACVFGGYLMTGGSLGVVFEALPHEILTIFGAAIADDGRICGKPQSVAAGRHVSSRAKSRDLLLRVPRWDASVETSLDTVRKDVRHE